MVKVEKIEYIEYRNVLKISIKLLWIMHISLILKNINDSNTYKSNFSFSSLLLDINFYYRNCKNNYDIVIKLLKIIKIKSELKNNITFNSVDYFNKKVFLSEIKQLEYIKDNINYLNVTEIEKPIDIIIPIYNGFQYLDKLFNSIYNSTKISYRLIVIDDKSTDNRILSFLENLNFNNDLYCKEIIILKNEENLGFVKTVNKASKLVKNHFVLLNTDVELPKNWLERLIRPLYEYKKEKIASITPFTNKGVYFSYPINKINNELINNLTLEEIDKIFQQINPIFTNNQIIHSGMGYCMAINYDCWEEIGGFDEELFEKGYGEENDWCFRAIQKGYINILVPNLFVYHKHSGSFGSEEREKLVERHLSILANKYPKEMELCRKFDIENNFSLYRLYANFYLSKSFSKNLLFIDFEVYSGGAYAYSQNKIKKFINEGYNIITLRHNSINNTLKIFFTNFNDEECLYLDNISEVYFILKKLNIEYVFINNLVFLDNNHLTILFDILEKNKEIYKYQLEYVFHDFFSICQSFFLVNDKDMFCGIPDTKICRKCNKIEKYLSIDVYRKMWDKFLSISNILTCFSKPSYDIIVSVYPNIKNKLQIIPHEILINYKEKYNPNWNNNILNIGFFGNFHPVKGSNIILDLDNKLIKSNIKYSIKLFGEKTVEYNQEEYLNINYIGKYERNNIPNLLNSHYIDIVIFTSIWPETFSYVIQELMEAKVPIICFNLGAPAERVSHYDKGYIVNEISAEGIYKELLKFYKNNKE